MNILSEIGDRPDALLLTGKRMSDIEKLLDSHIGFPPAFYSDPAVYRFEMNAIFHRKWQYFAPLAQASNPGDVVTGMVGTTPIVVVRTKDGELRGFVNMCRHRMFPVVEKNASNCTRLMCRYHSWTYSLEGKLVRAPDTDHEPGFEKSENGLIPISVDVWGPAIFVNALPDTPPLRDAMPELYALTKEQNFDEDASSYKFLSSYTKVQAANWKLWSDNSVECYHCDAVHGASFTEIVEADVEAGEQTLRHAGSIMYNPFKILPPKPGRTTATSYKTLLLFPGAHFLQIDELMVLGRMVPTGPESCSYTANYFIKDGADRSRIERFAEIFNQTFDEDAQLVEKQQIALASPFASPLRYVKSREPAALLTNRLILAALKDHAGQLDQLD